MTHGRWFATARSSSPASRATSKRGRRRSATISGPIWKSSDAELRTSPDLPQFIRQQNYVVADSDLMPQLEMKDH
jgi:hypothetical protein